MESLWRDSHSSLMVFFNSIVSYDVSCVLEFELQIAAAEQSEAVEYSSACAGKAATARLRPAA